MSSGLVPERPASARRLPIGPQPEGRGRRQPGVPGAGPGARGSRSSWSPRRPGGEVAATGPCQAGAGVRPRAGCRGAGSYQRGQLAACPFASAPAQFNGHCPPVPLFRRRPLPAGLGWGGPAGNAPSRGRPGRVRGDGHLPGGAPGPHEGGLGLLVCRRGVARMSPPGEGQRGLAHEVRSVEPTEGLGKAEEHPQLGAPPSLLSPPDPWKGRQARRGRTARVRTQITAGGKPSPTASLQEEPTRDARPEAGPRPRRGEGTAQALPHQGPGLATPLPLGSATRSCAPWTGISLALANLCPVLRVPTRWALCGCQQHSGWLGLSHMLTLSREWAPWTGGRWEQPWHHNSPVLGQPVEAHPS